MNDLTHDLLTLFFLVADFLDLVIPAAVAGLVRSGFLLLLPLAGLGGDGALGGLGGRGGLRVMPGLIVGLVICLLPCKTFFARLMAALLWLAVVSLFLGGVVRVITTGVLAVLTVGISRRARRPPVKNGCVNTLSNDGKSLFLELFIVPRNRKFLILLDLNPR
jgi:hypothetical protein